MFVSIQELSFPPFLNSDNLHYLFSSNQVANTTLQAKCQNLMFLLSKDTTALQFLDNWRLSAEGWQNSLILKRFNNMWFQPTITLNLIP